MKLKENLDLNLFIKAVKKCEKDVFFVTKKGDYLNLKSTLTQYFFINNATKNGDTYLQSGEIACIRESDVAMISEFLEEY